jgi:hypothetical protein
MNGAKAGDKDLAAHLAIGLGEGAQGGLGLGGTERARWPAGARVPWVLSSIADRSIVAQSIGENKLTKGMR